MSGLTGFLTYSLIIALVVVSYWLPTIIATYRRTNLPKSATTPNIAQTAVINGLLGWTLIGYVVALLFALRTPVELRQIGGAS
jgi:hypothetical protein